MIKRLSIRLVPKLNEQLKSIALERGSSMNGLISQILWEFIDEYSKYTEKQERISVCKE